MADSAYNKYGQNNIRAGANGDGVIAQHASLCNIPSVTQGASNKSLPAINYSTSSAKTIAFKSVSVRSTNHSHTPSKKERKSNNSTQTTRLKVVKGNPSKTSANNYKNTPVSHRKKPTDVQRALRSLDENEVSSNLVKYKDQPESSDTIEALKYAAELFAQDAPSHTSDMQTNLKVIQDDSGLRSSKRSATGENAASKYLRGLHVSDKGKSRKKSKEAGKHSKNNRDLKRANEDFDKFITTNFEDVQNQEEQNLAQQDDLVNDEGADTSREDGSAAAARYTNRKKKSRRQKRKEERERKAAIEANKKPLLESMDSATSRSGRKASEKANSSQRKIVHSFARTAKTSMSAADSIARRASRSIKLKGVAVVAILILVAGGILYPAAREYYVSVRNLDRANIYLAQLQERNDQLQENIDALSTDAGIENYARAQYGWVKNGEEAVSVIGLPTNSQTTTLSTAATSNIKENKSAITAFLDAIFFVN